MRNVQSLKLVCVSILLALGISACATNRSVIAVAAPIGEQPKSNSFAKITEVRDLRQFSVNPNDPSLPSLRSAEEIQDAKITGRAVARKRNGFGMALGDVMIPETTSVAGLVRDSAKKALQDKGYVVVDESSPNYAHALPLAIDIEQFWSWMKPGFATLTFTFNSSVVLKGSGLLGADNPAIKSQTIVNSAFGTESVWRESVQNGVNDLTEQMKQHIKASSDASPPVV